MDTVRVPGEPSLEIKPARQFKACSVLAINLYGVLLGLPVLAAVAWVSFRPLDAATYILPVVAVLVATAFLPVGFGNPHARLISRRLSPPFPLQDARVVQLTTQPRIRTGLRAMLEDADDIGCLRVTETGLAFFGDSVRLEAPFECIETVCLKNIGLRGLYIYAPRISMKIKGVTPGDFEFADRSSVSLMSARRQTRELYNMLSAKVAKARQTE